MAFLVAFDLTKAFDRVPLLCVLFNLRRIGAPDSVIKARRAWHRSLRRCWRLGVALGPWWTQSNGILQGDPLSPDQLNLLLLPLFHALDMRCPEVRYWVYVDDILLEGGSIAQMQLAAGIVNDFFQLLNIPINAKKSLWMQEGGDHLPKAERTLALPIGAVGVLIPKADSLRYLGVTLWTGTFPTLAESDIAVCKVLTMVRKLRFAPVSDHTRAYVASAILQAVSYRAVNLAPSTDWRTLVREIAFSITKSRDPTRVPEIVLGVGRKLHLCYPPARWMYSSVRTIIRGLLTHHECRSSLLDALVCWTAQPAEARAEFHNTCCIGQWVSTLDTLGISLSTSGVLSIRGHDLDTSALYLWTDFRRASLVGGISIAISIKWWNTLIATEVQPWLHVVRRCIRELFW